MVLFPFWGYSEGHSTHMQLCAAWREANFSCLQKGDTQRGRPDPWSICISFLWWICGQKCNQEPNSMDQYQTARSYSHIQKKYLAEPEHQNHIVAECFQFHPNIFALLLPYVLTQCSSQHYELWQTSFNDNALQYGASTQYSYPTH